MFQDLICLETGHYQFNQILGLCPPFYPLQLHLAVYFTEPLRKTNIEKSLKVFYAILPFARQLHFLLIASCLHHYRHPNSKYSRLLLLH